MAVLMFSLLASSHRPMAGVLSGLNLSQETVKEPPGKLLLCEF